MMVLMLHDPDGKPLNFGNIGSEQPQINELGPQAWRSQVSESANGNLQLVAIREMSNDYAVFRYADVLLMKAEALFRKGNTACCIAAC